MDKETPFMRKNIPLANNGEGGASAPQTKTTLQKQAIFIGVAAGIVALFLIFYFAILPLIKSGVAKVDYVYPGEYYDGSTLYMVKPRYRADITKIEVNNKHGTYVLNAKGSGSGKTFLIEGASETKLDEYSLSAVVVAAGQPIAAPSDSKNYRANERATEADLARYGLDAASNPGWFRVTLTDGTSYKIVYGNKLPTSKNCYAYVEGEDRMNVVTNDDGTTSSYYIVYSLDALSYEALLYDKTALVNPLIGTSYLGNGVYYTTNFEVHRYDDKEGKRTPVINITQADYAISGVTQYDIVYPGGYNLDDAVFTQQVLPTMSNFVADAVVAIGDDVYKEEVYTKYHLDLDRERLENGTDKNHTKFYIKALDSNSKDCEITIYVSAKQLLSDGTSCYYVYLPEQHEIVKISAETFAWLDWDFGPYVDLRMFFEYIGSLDYYTVLADSKGLDVRFTLTGNPFNHHVAVTDSTGKTVLVDENGDEIVFDVEWEAGVVKPNFKGDFENFRSLYYVLITRMLDGSEEPVKIEEDDECVYTVIVQSVQRDRNEQFYRYLSDGSYDRDENGKSQVVTYEGGYMHVRNLIGYNKDGYKLTYENAFFDEATGKFFVKVKDTADGNEKPRSYEYTEDKKMVPKFLPLTNTTAEYTTVTYEYKFYNLYTEVTGDDGTVTEQISQTYMLVVPTTTTTVWRIEADGSRTMVSQEVSESNDMGFHIRTAVVEKLLSDTDKALKGIKIDPYGVN